MVSSFNYVFIRTYPWTRNPAWPWWCSIDGCLATGITCWCIKIPLLESLARQDVHVDK